MCWSRWYMCTEKETSSRESREGLVGSEQQDDTPASVPYTASHSNKQHGARYNQQQQPMPAVSSSQRLKNPATCRVLMIDGIEYELAVEVLCKMFVIWAYLVFLVASHITICTVLVQLRRRWKCRTGICEQMRRKCADQISGTENVERNAGPDCA